jgi:hypothetical protein
MFGELSISTQSGRKIAGAVSSRAAYSPTAAAPPPCETGADDAAFPSLVASYCRPRPIFQVRASGELAWRSTRKGVVRGAASARDGEAFSMPAGEGSEADRSEGRSKRQKEKERGEGAGRRIRQRPTRLARPRVDAPHWSPTIVEGNSARGRDESEQRACWEVGSRAGTM